MEFLKLLPCPCGGAVLEHMKQLLSPDAKPGAEEEVHLAALGANESSVHNTRIHLDIYRDIMSSAPRVLLYRSIPLGARNFLNWT